MRAFHRRVRIFLATTLTILSRRSKKRRFYSSSRRTQTSINRLLSPKRKTKKARKSKKKMEVNSPEASTNLKCSAKTTKSSSTKTAPKMLRANPRHQTVNPCKEISRARSSLLERTTWICIQMMGGASPFRPTSCRYRRFWPNCSTRQRCSRWAWNNQSKIIDKR